MRFLSASFRSRTRSFWLLLLIFGLAFPLSGQEEDIDSEPEDEPPVIIWDTYEPELYMAGDQMFVLSAGIIFPTFFSGDGMEGNPPNIDLGGMGSVSYSFFLSPNWFVGGEFQGMFVGTGGKNMLYIIPFGIHGGYQFTRGRFEFPLRLMIGGAAQLYLDKNHFGFIIKPGASAYYRFNADWSYGLNVQWWMLPQAPTNNRFVLGNFMEISLSMRYHPRSR